MNRLFISFLLCFHLQKTFIVIRDKPKIAPHPHPPRGFIVITPIADRVPEIGVPVAASLLAWAFVQHVKFGADLTNLCSNCNNFLFYGKTQYSATTP